MNYPRITNGSRSFTYAPLRTSGENLKTFIRLFRVDFTHGYYTQQDGRCADFRVVPTPTTATLMTSLGLLFKDEGSGFSIFALPEGLPNLIAYLRREAQSTSAGPTFWSRLSFLLMLDNPLFVAITALPIGTKQTQVNLYGCNREAHRDDAAILLSKGAHMGADALYPIVGSEISLTLPPGARRVTVADISGTIVIPQPGGDEITIYDRGPEGRGLRHASIDLSDLPYDLYTIAIEDDRNQPLDTPGYPRTLLYVPGRSETIALLDMLFTAPTPDSSGIYPIPPLFDGDPDPAQCGDIAYRLPFEARSTYWQYFVVSQQPAGKLHNLKIEGAGARFEEQADPVPLPDGSLAIRFDSDTALPLRQKSPQHFHLSGQRRDASGQENPILIVRLPVAPAMPVWPPGPTHQNTTGTSEMFVYV